MAVTSGELLKRFGMPSTYLHRWREEGFILPEMTAARRDLGAVWPDWTVRMVALLRATAGSWPFSEPRDGLRRREALCLVADVLAAHPAVPWVVLTGDGIAIPCWTAEDVATLHQGRICTTVIAIPSLEQACQ